MNTLLWMIRKELAVFFSDVKGAAMLIVVPLVLGIMMGLIFNPSEGPSPLDIVVVNEDGGPEVADLIARLDAEPSLEVTQMNAEEARAKVAGGDIGVALRIPAGSGAHLKPAALFSGGEKGSLTMWVDPSRQVEAGIVQGLLTKTMMESLFSRVGEPTAQRQMFSDLRQSLGDEAAERPELAQFLDQGMAFADENEAQAGGPPTGGPQAGGPPTGGAQAGGPPTGGGGMSLEPPLTVSTEPVVAAGPTAGFSSHAHTFAGMLMQFLLFAASGHAKTLFAERASGTLDRLRMTAASKTQILLGTALALSVVCLIATVVVFGVGALLFEVPFRSGLLAFSAVAVGQALFVGSFALLLAGLANSEKQLDSVGTLLVLTLCFISGAWVPAFMLPQFLQSLGPLVPTRWILDGMAGATWRGLGLTHALGHAGALAAFSALFAVIGIKRFRWS